MKHRSYQLSLLLCGCALLGAGCKLDGNKVEAAIIDRFATDGIEIASMDCPDDRKLVAGDEFDCQGKTDRGDAFLVHVKQTNDQGAVSWTHDGVIIDPKRLLKGIFDCGDKKLIAIKGTKMSCTVSNRSVELVFIDDKGTLDEASIKAMIEQP